MQESFQFFVKYVTIKFNKSSLIFRNIIVSQFYNSLYVVGLSWIFFDKDLPQRNTKQHNYRSKLLSLL